MTIEQVPQEKSQYRRPFSESGSPHREMAGLNPSLQSLLIERCLKQLGEKVLLGEPYLKDYLYDQKRRNCRPNTIRSNFMTLRLFLSYLKERGRTSCEWKGTCLSASSRFTTNRTQLFPTACPTPCCRRIVRPRPRRC